MYSIYVAFFNWVIMFNDHMATNPTNSHMTNTTILKYAVRMSQDLTMPF
jgi:hypothetical protein